MSKRPLDHIVERALVFGATARLTRLVVADDLGQWWVKDPLYRLVAKHASQGAPTWEPPATDRLITAEEAAGSLHYPLPRWARYLDGLDCPHCAGFWIGVGVLGVTEATRGTPLQRPWRAVMTALSLNAAVVAVWGKLDYWE